MNSHENWHENRAGYHSNKRGPKNKRTPLSSITLEDRSLLFLVDKMCLTLVKGLSDCRTRSLDIINKVYSLPLSLQSSGDAVDLAQNLKKVTPTVLYIPTKWKTHKTMPKSPQNTSVSSLSLSYSLSRSLLFSFYGKSKCMCTFSPAARSKYTSCFICTCRASVGFL